MAKTTPSVRPHFDPDMDFPDSRYDFQDSGPDDTGDDGCH